MKPIALWIAGTLLTMVCPQIILGDTVDSGEVTVKSMYWNEGRHLGKPGQFHVNACFVIAPGMTPTQAQLNNIRDIINEWSQGYTGFRYIWRETDPATMTSITIGALTYRSSCPQNSDGTFQDPVRIIIRNPPPAIQTTLPPNLTVPGCSSHEVVGSRIIDGDGDVICQQSDNAGNPVFDASGDRVWVKCKKPYTAGQHYRVGSPLWSSSPQDMYKNKTCLYTSNLALNQPRNNYLHESGHGLGFQHEQNRDDAVCEPAPPGGIKITGYDQNSVMHYVLHCPDGTDTPGNWGNTGLSSEDQLAMEVVYPPHLVPKIYGDLVGAEGGSISARPTWDLQGIRFSSISDQAVLKNISWQVDGKLFSTRVQPGSREWKSLSPGRHMLRLQFDSIWNDHYDGSVVIEMLPSIKAYDERIAATTTVTF